jgi:uncharacterized protein YcsI (UPF0317 family)
MDNEHLMTADELRGATAAEVRAAVRAGRYTGPTAGLAPGYVQANLVVLPTEFAAEFTEFCHLNPQPCPLLTQTLPGIAEPRACAPGADLRSDLPRYRVFRDGQFEATEPTNVRDLWRKDLVGFLLGCSFTFESALVREGLSVRHIDQGCNVPMYRTSLRCRSAGRFSSNMVVSMRPFPRAQVERAIAITARYPTMHGAPVHVGDPAELGIEDLGHPDFGDAVTLFPGDVPLFWACGVTPQLALASSGCSLAITHSPGAMFITDWREADEEVTTESMRAPLKSR